MTDPDQEPAVDDITQLKRRLEETGAASKAPTGQSASSAASESMGKTEQATYLSEERFRSLFENMTEGFVLNEFVFDEQGNYCDYRFLEVNPAFELLTGFKRVDIIGKLASSILPETELHWIEGFRQLALTRQPVQFDQYSPALNRFFRIYAYSSEPGTFAAVFMDITETKQIELLLNQVAKKYYALFNSTSDGVWIQNLAGEILEVNDAYCQMSGYSREELLHLNTSALEAIESHADIAAGIQRRIQHTGHDRYESVHRRKDGSPLYVDITALYHDREKGHIAIFVRDITTRKKAEDAIRRSEAMLRAVLSQMLAGVTVRDAQTGTLLLANNQAMEIMGELPEDSSQFSAYYGSHLDGSPIAQHEWPIIRSMTTGEVVNLEELEYVRRDGNRIIISTSSTPIRDSQGKIIMGVATFQDITARKQAERRLQYLASFPEGNPNPIVEIDLQGNILYANPSVRRLFPDLPDRGPAHPWVAQLEPIIDQIKPGQANIFTREVTVGERAYQQSVHYIAPEGLIRIYGQDITQRIKAEASLHQSQKRLIKAQEIAHLGSWELDLIKNHLTWSDEVYRIFGFTPQEFPATYEAFLNAVHPDDRSAVDAAYRGSIEQNRDGYEIGHRVVNHLTGEERIVYEKCVHVRDESGKIIGSEGMVHDITEQRLAEMDLLKMRIGLEQRVQERTMELGLANENLRNENIQREKIQTDLEASLQELQVIEEELRNNNEMLIDAQNILDDERQRYQDLFEFAPDGYLVTDGNGKILNANKVASELFKIAHKRLLGKPLVVFVDRNEHELFEHLLLDLRQMKLVQSQEFKLIPRQGDAFIAFVSVVVSKDGLGNDTLRWIIRDITERKRSEELIRQNSARNAFLVEITRSLEAASLDEQAIINTVAKTTARSIGDSCVISMASADGQWLDPLAWNHREPNANKLMDKLYKTTRHPITEGISGRVYQTSQAQLIKKIDPSIGQPDISPAYHEYIEQVGVTSIIIVPMYVGEQIVGTLGVSRDHGSPPYTEEDLALVEILVDRTDQAINNARLYKELQKALHNELEARNRLVQAEKFAAVGRLLASITHEINNPLQTIKNCLYLSQVDTRIDPHSSEYLKLAAVETDRLSNLVAQLREIYRPPIQSQVTEVNLTTLLGEVQTLLAGYLQEKHVSWSVNMENAGLLKDITIEAVPDQLKQVFLNLGLNSIDAMEPDGGRIMIDLKIPGDTTEVGICFQDTGPGLPDEVRERMFEPFITTKEKGMGLGLMICYDIIQKHHGRIDVASEPGQGAAFTVWLPARREST